MTKREVANLACRILAIYAWLQAVSGVPYLVGLAGPAVSEYPWSNEQLFSQVVYALHPILIFLAGMFLWKWSGLIAAWMVGYDIQDHQFEPESSPRRIQARELHSIAYSTLGLWILIDLLPRAISYGAQLIYFGSETELTEPRSYFTASVLLELGLRLFVGIWLLFGARGFVNLLRTLRTAGVDDAAQ